jgi:hypothetical protein
VTVLLVPLLPDGNVHGSAKRPRSQIEMELETMRRMMNQEANENSAPGNVPDGQERLATQVERDEVSHIIGDPQLPAAKQGSQPSG